MIDLHCHILPGVDDGAANLAEALRMARIYVRDGITHVTATPHCNRGYRLMRADVLPLVARFNEELRKAGIPLTVLPGSEIQVVDTAAYRREYEQGLYCHLGDRPAFSLTEFSWKREEFPPDAHELIRWLVARGTTPIIAHPERHNYYADHPEWLAALVREGAWLQVTVDSLLGTNGKAPRQWGEKLLASEDANIVLATDAHNIDRCSGLAVGYAWVRERFGNQFEERLRAQSDRVLQELTAEVVAAG